MFYIKLDENKNLVTTVCEPIYRGENLNKKIIYLIPPTVDDIDILTATIYLSYIRADGVADIVLLERTDKMYKEAYYQYTMPITCKLTRYPGEICSWLQIYSGTPSNPTIVKSGENTLYVQESKCMDDYFCDHQMTVLYQIQKKMEDGLEKVEESITEVEAEVSAKADNLIFDSEDSTIQLTAGGEPIGDKISVAAANGIGISDMRISVDGELLAFFDNGDIKNLGKVVGDNGMVYVPHIDEHKILTFTLETDPDGIPDPVDLNPDDEWDGIDGDGGETDYVWEEIGGGDDGNSNSGETNDTWGGIDGDSDGDTNGDGDGSDNGGSNSGGSDSTWEGM